MLRPDEAPALHIAVGLVWFQGKILIARRHAAAHQGSKWEFPGGKIQPGETELAAVVREVHEETGLQVRALEVRCRLRHAYPDRVVELAIIDCDASSAQAAALGSAEVRWVTREELANYDFPAANLDLIRQLTSEPVAS